MAGTFKRKVQDLGRGVIGALMLGMPLLYTMETWWLGWRLPPWLLLAWSLGGLAFISLLFHVIGFREKVDEREEPWWRELADYLELLATSFVTGLLILLLFGIIEWGDSLGAVVRLSLIQVVPLGIGAAITNQMLAGNEEEAEQPVDFTREMAIFALGVLFFAFNVAPTEEMELMAAHAGPWRLVLVLVVGLVSTYLALYVMHFRGRAGRTASAPSKWVQWGETLSGYFIALVVTALLLWGYGHFIDNTFHEMVQKTIVISFIGALGGAAARVAI